MIRDSERPHFITRHLTAALASPFSLYSIYFDTHHHTQPIMAPTRQQPAPLYNKDEKVLCFHGELLYEAKIMDVQAGDKSNSGEAWDYKVHYKGWKKTWDDWVGKDRIRPFDDEHKELAAQLHAQAKRSMQASAKPTTKAGKVGNDSTRGSEERGSAAVQGGRGGRRGKDWELEQVSDPFSLPHSQTLPDSAAVCCESIVVCSLCAFLFSAALRCGSRTAAVKWPPTQQRAASSAVTPSTLHRRERAAAIQLDLTLSTRAKVKASHEKVWPTPRVQWSPFPFTVVLPHSLPPYPLKA